MSAGPWVVDDYRTPAGGRPVKEFLDGLSKTAHPKVYAVLAMLEAHGNRLAMPKSKPGGAGLYELRIAHPGGPFRILYCFRSGRRIFLLHGFVKRTEQTPQGALDLARERQRALATER
jgi:phage-related protein